MKQCQWLGGPVIFAVGGFCWNRWTDNPIYKMFQFYFFLDSPHHCTWPGCTGYHPKVNEKIHVAWEEKPTECLKLSYILWRVSDFLVCDDFINVHFNTLHYFQQFLQNDFKSKESLQAGWVAPYISGCGRQKITLPVQAHVFILILTRNPSQPSGVWRRTAQWYLCCSWAPPCLRHQIMWVAKGQRVKAFGKPPSLETDPATFKIITGLMS